MKRSASTALVIFGNSRLPLISMILVELFAVVLTVAFLGFAADRLYLLIMQRMMRWKE